MTSPSYVFINSPHSFIYIIKEQHLKTANAKDLVQYRLGDAAENSSVHYKGSVIFIYFHSIICGNFSN